MRLEKKRVNGPREETEVICPFCHNYLDLVIDEGKKMLSCPKCAFYVEPEKMSLDYEEKARHFAEEIGYLKKQAAALYLITVRERKFI